MLRQLADVLRVPARKAGNTVEAKLLRSLLERQGSDNFLLLGSKNESA
jgi:hypothetical protein